MIAFTGVVEDIHDPDNSNLVKVRILGIHTNDKSLIPTKDLMWSKVSMSTDNAGTSGIGNSPHGMVHGTVVHGFFLDGTDMQQPLITGVLLGKPEDTANPQKGFNDPDGKYPTKTNEPDVNRLARGDIKDTVIEKNNNSLSKGVEEADGSTWDEPPSPYKAKYPYNKVHESESGHVFEIDDTEGSERINTKHRTGTGTEVHPDGTEVHRVVGDGYSIYAKDKKVYIKGVCSVTVENECNINAKKKVTVKAPEIELGTDGSEPIVMGNKLKKWIESVLVTWANSHTHTGNLGSPTSPPLSPLEPEDVYSKKNKSQ